MPFMPWILVITIRHHKWFPFNACSRLKWCTLKVSFRTHYSPNIYINDLQCHLKGATAGNFADETRLSKQISSCDDVLILQENLNTVVKWATENNMVLHDGKFEYLDYRIASSKLQEELPLTAQWVHYSTPSGQDLTPASSVKDLGVHLSPGMKWSLQALSQVKMQIKWPTGCSVSSQTGLKMCSVHKTIVRSKLEYSCPVWNPPSMQDIKKLESTQRAFTRYSSGCRCLSYWDRLKKLGLMSLQRRRERYAILQLWKIWQCAVPNDLDIQFYDHTRLCTRLVHAYQATQRSYQATRGSDQATRGSYQATRASPEAWSGKLWHDVILKGN